MNIKKSVKPAQNTERDRKVQKVKAELNQRINEEFPAIHQRLFQRILSLGWLGWGAIVVTGLVTWSIGGHLNIPIFAKSLLAIISCSFVGNLASKNTMRSEKRFRSSQESHQEPLYFSNSPKGSYLDEGEVAVGMSRSEAIAILGEPHRKATWAELTEGKKVIGLSANSPRWQDEYWLYIFDEFEYQIVIRDGKVSSVEKIEKKAEGKPRNSRSVNASSKHLERRNIPDVRTIISTASKLPEVTDADIQQNFYKVRGTWGAKEILTMSEADLRGAVADIVTGDAKEGFKLAMCDTDNLNGRMLQFNTVREISHAHFGGEFRGYRIAKKQSDRYALFGHSSMYPNVSSCDMSLNSLVQELLKIGRQVKDPSSSASGYMCFDEKGDLAESSRAKEIGEQIDSIGGMDAMRAAYKVILERLGSEAARELEIIWDGIGGWLG